TLQIINGEDLHKIPENQLKFPRLIVEHTGYNDSDYDYTNSSFNSDRDVIEFEIEKIPKVTYRFRIYNDSSNSINIFNLLNKIHVFYSNPYQTKLKGDMQVVATDMIMQVSSGINYDYTLGYQFTMDFNMSEKIIMDIDYAEELNVKLRVKTENDTEMVEHINIKKK
ncbi:MAG: hypothetical protein ACRC7S_06380, partial [Cetobacterium sp.]